MCCTLWAIFVIRYFFPQYGKNVDVTNFNSDANADNMHPSDPTTGMIAGNYHDDVIKWKHLPRYWPLEQGIHRSPVNPPPPPPHKSQWRGALMFSLICARLNGWVNSREVGDLRRYRAHYDVIGMMFMINWHPFVPATTLLVKIMILMTGPSFCMAAEIKQFRKTYKYNFIFVHVDRNNYRYKSVPLQEILRGRFVNLFFYKWIKTKQQFSEFKLSVWCRRVHHTHTGQVYLKWGC